MDIEDLDTQLNSQESIEIQEPETTDFVIEQDIPLPDDIRGAQTKYPWSKLAAGHSIFCPLKEGDDAKRLKNRLSQSTRTFGRKQDPERHFVIRYRLENEISGVRVWRKD